MKRESACPDRARVGETVAPFGGGGGFKLDPVAISDGRSYRDNNVIASADAPIGSV